MATVAITRLLAALDADIREHQHFIADPAHYTTAPAQARLDALRKTRDALAVWASPISCSCSRGGHATTCECQNWPDAIARRQLKGEF